MHIPFIVCISIVLLQCVYTEQEVYWMGLAIMRAVLGYHQSVVVKKRFPIVE